MRKRNSSKVSGANDALFGGACLVAIIALGLCSAPAKAQDAASQKTGPEVAFNAAIGSDYVFRGVSQTEGDPAISAGVDVTQGLFYAGAWAGNVSFAGTPTPTPRSTSTPASGPSSAASTGTSAWSAISTPVSRTGPTTTMSS